MAQVVVYSAQGVMALTRLEVARHALQTVKFVAQLSVYSVQSDMA